MNKSKLEQVKNWYRSLPDKKRYFEFISAVLTIPVMLTVLITNTINLQSQHKDSTAVPSPLAAVTVTPLAESGTNYSAKQKTKAAPETPVPTASSAPEEAGKNSALPSASAPPPECIQGIGPVSISYPQENEVVSGDPVCIDISRQSTNYCSIVWSYKINDKPWSDYLDKEVCLYGLTPGQVQLQVKVHSVVNNEEVVLNRHFGVAGPAPTHEASGSGSTLPQ